MSDERYPTAPTDSLRADSGDPALRSTSAVPSASTNATDYAAHRAAVSGLRVERDPSVTIDTAESSMAEVRARMMGQTIGITPGGLSPKLAAQRDARMAEQANYTRHPEMATSTPLQEQTQEAIPPVRPGAQKPDAGRPVQNLKGAKAQPSANKIVGKFTAMLARRQQQQLQPLGTKPKGSAR